MSFARSDEPVAAEYGGISVARHVVLAMFISGMLAGMVGINEVLGYRYRYYDGFPPGTASRDSGGLAWEKSSVRRFACGDLVGALIRSGFS